MFRVLDRVTLKKAMPALGLNRGAVGSIVTVRSKDVGYEVEFPAPVGKPTVVAILKSSSLKAAEH